MQKDAPPSLCATDQVMSSVVLEWCKSTLTCFKPPNPKVNCCAPCFLHLFAFRWLNENVLWRYDGYPGVGSQISTMLQRSHFHNQTESSNMKSSFLQITVKQYERNQSSPLPKNKRTNSWEQSVTTKPPFHYISEFISATLAKTILSRYASTRVSLRVSNVYVVWIFGPEISTLCAVRITVFDPHQQSLLSDLVKKIHSFHQLLTDCKNIE